ncbi:MAG TPA: hypothetical protein VFO78_04475 [Candidatus Limnocylindrales bacterium]|nr:hypothetical protein [Candidatus Limnocylindrales bacterium]
MPPRRDGIRRAHHGSFLRIGRDDRAAGKPGEHSGLERALDRRTPARAFDQLDASDRLLMTLHDFWQSPIAEIAAISASPSNGEIALPFAMNRLRAAPAAGSRR